MAGSARGALPPGHETFLKTISRLVGRDLVARKPGRKPKTPKRPKRGPAAEEKEKQVLRPPIPPG